jgi:hypothetical protein
MARKEKLTVKIHSFYFSNGVYVKWSPVNENGKGHDLFNVVIEFPSTDRGSDIIREQKMGPASAAASLHLLKWAIKDRNNITK